MAGTRPPDMTKSMPRRPRPYQGVRPSAGRGRGPVYRLVKRAHNGAKRSFLTAIQSRILARAFFKNCKFARLGSGWMRCTRGQSSGYKNTSSNVGKVDRFAGGNFGTVGSGQHVLRDCRQPPRKSLGRSSAHRCSVDDTRIRTTRATASTRGVICRLRSSSLALAARS